MQLGIFNYILSNTPHIHHLTHNINNLKHKSTFLDKTIRFTN